MGTIRHVDWYRSMCLIIPILDNQNVDCYRLCVCCSHIDNQNVDWYQLCVCCTHIATIRHVDRYRSMCLIILILEQSDM